MKKYVSIVFFLFLTSALFPQTVARFTLGNTAPRQTGPVSVPLLLPDNPSADSTTLRLFTTQQNKNIGVPCQYDDGLLWFYADGPERTYTLKREKSLPRTVRMHVRDEKGSFVLYDGDKPILAYRHADMPAPAGADTLFHRSGYIHPLYSPSGMVLTGIQPSDHLHHYGIWGPWTKTHIDGREVDFWNLGKGEGRVRYGGLLSIVEGDLFCSITVRQEHIYYDDAGREHPAIDEALTIRAWCLPGDDGWLVDYLTTQSTSLPRGIELDQYRYGGGLGYRATGAWDKDNSTVLTSGGKTRDNADASRARWCRVEGISPAGHSGILFLDHPANRDFPEPTRVWPPDIPIDNGPLFVEFCPIRLHGWHFAYGEKHTLRYRMYVYDGHCPKEKAEALWQGFAEKTKTTFTKIPHP